MMKVYFINCTYGHGGPGDVSKNLFKYFETKGITCRFACSRYGEKNSNFYKIGNKIDIFIHYVLSKLFDNEGFNSRISTRRLIADIKKFNPDIINLHSLMGHFVNYKILFSFLKKSNYKVIWTLHDCSSFTGHCINFERIGCEKWKECCHNCLLKTDYPKSILFDSSRKNFLKKRKLFLSLKKTQLITPSNWLKSLVFQSFMRKYDCKCIHNGIDLTCFKPIKDSFVDKYDLMNKKVLLFVAGVWNEMKGINIVNQLASLVDDSYKIVVIGKCDVNLDDSILHFDRTSDRNELVKWYNTASIFVNPTLGDNFPTVNIEALACGKPVVTFKTGGSPEAIDSNTGVVVSTKDALHLYEGIKECFHLINNKVISREKCILKTQEFTLEHFSEEYYKLFRQVKEYEKEF